MDPHVSNYVVVDIEIRKKLAAAGAEWGEIIPGVGGDHEKTAEKFKELIQDREMKKLILVGDIVTDTCAKVGIKIDLAIVDGKTHRGFYQGNQGTFESLRSVDNPPGEIRQEAWEIIANILEENRNCLLSVNGEEDLLAIPVIMEAPVPSIVAFGQPPVTDAEPPLPEGIAYIEVTPEVKKKCGDILEALKTA